MVRNIIICIDGSSCANYAFRWASENLLRADDHVILLHATKDFKKLENSSSGSASTGSLASGTKQWAPENIRQYEEKVVEQARLLTQQYTSQLTADKIKHEAIVTKGDPRSIILDHIERYNPTAVVMGTRGLGIIKRSILGSVSDFILHNSTAPIIVVREQSQQ